jgi:signal transduction histidine kinase
MYGFCLRTVFLVQTPERLDIPVCVRGAIFSWSRRAVVRCSLLLAGGMVATGMARAEQAPAGRPFPAVTNVAQVRRLASQNPGASCFVQLAGTVWWADPAQGRMVLQDTSGAEELEMDLSDLTVQAGQRVRVQGNGTLIRNGAAFKIGARGPVVDNNGVHSMTEKSGAVYLKAGRHPLRVEWFNGVEKYGLQVEYEGPGVPRQRIPDSALYRIQAEATDESSHSHSVHGLDYGCYAVTGEVLPDFSLLTPLKTGVMSNFDLSVISREEHVGMRFTGEIEVPEAGLYTFYSTSDDGSRLFVGEPSMRLEVIGHAPFPQPRQIAIGQTLREDEAGQWVEVEGRVTLARGREPGLQLELSAGGGRLRVEVANGSGLSATSLLNSRIRAVGFSQSTFTTDGQRVAGLLLVPGAGQIEPIPPPSETLEGVNTNAAGLPVLTNGGEVHRLKREQAQQGYPVKIRGVITSVLPEHQAFVIQDSTRGLYVEDHSEVRSRPPEIGEYLEVEGTTDPSLFAPIVDARQVRSLGAGRLPDPVQPTWDQLMNGSLDAQYVELQGIVTAVLEDGVTLRTRGGVIKIVLRLTGMKPEDLRRCENALVRIRGCLYASWDYATHHVMVGEIRIYDADIMVDQPAPQDLFSSPSKTPAELLLFDPKAGEFERVKVTGQIVYSREPEYFMMQGGNGLRFIVKQPAELRVGDVVEAVGFPELSGSGSPVLREAVTRKLAQGPLPEARRLRPDQLMRADYDSTRVRLDGLLVSVRKTQSDQVLEMQSGVRTFLARLNNPDESVESLAVGSRLELVGVYAGQGGNRAAGQDITSFELLLNGPSDIKVLARPPWWTLERLLVIVGMLACVLAATVLWITQLHRQVEERTAELGEQIKERQRVEHQRAMEQERARIAQDLHDELGSGITEISMLAVRAKSASPPDEKNHRYLEQVRDRAREMVTALDEIVWAMNPRHDSLASLVSYFCLYADRFLGVAGIALRLEGPSGSPDCSVDSRLRHQLFLAFKEALTNVVRHSGATEVHLGIQVEHGQVRLSIADNGRGLSSGDRRDDMDGVANMRARVERLGGRFEVASKPGGGTLVRFHIPVN